MAAPVSSLLLEHVRSPGDDNNITANDDDDDLSAGFLLNDGLLVPEWFLPPGFLSELSKPSDQEEAEIQAKLAAMGPHVRPKVRFGDLPSDEDSSIESNSGGGASLHQLGSTTKEVSFKTMGFNSTLSKSAVGKSCEPSCSAPGQIVKIEPGHRKDMPGEPNKNTLGETRRALHARNENVSLQETGTSKLNPAIAEFKPMGILNQASFETSLQRTFNLSASVPIFGSSTFFNSNLAASALEPSNAPPATTSTEIVSQNNQTFADQNTAMSTTTPAQLQQGQASHFFLPTNIVSQTQQTFENNNDINTNMSANLENQAFQPVPQANLQQMQPAQFTSQADWQQTFPTQPVPQIHASGIQQPLSNINRGNGADFNNSIRSDMLQQQGSYAPQSMPIGMDNRGDGTIFGTSINHGHMQQQVKYGPQPMTMDMGRQGQSQSQSQPSAPVSHEQAAMNALQAHLSRVEAEQAAIIQYDQTGKSRFQTPVRIGTARSSTPRITPSSYRLTPRSGLGSADLLSPNNVQVGGMFGRTEPRNFAPRNNGFVMDEQPPRFAIQAPVHMHHTNVQGISAAPQQYGGGHTVSASLEQPQGPGVGSGISPFRPGDDPFSSAHTGINKYGSSITDLIRPTQTSLSHVIEPIEPVSTALAMQNHPVPEYIRRQRSKQLNELTAAPNARPTAEVALHVDNFPFIEGPRCAQPSQNHGVVKLKNIPFAVRRSEIIAFLGRNSKILNDAEEPVHIIMERVTSKTNDAYVEFMSPQAAVAAVDRHQKNAAGGRHARLGDRPVEIELSSQSALMKDLFPLAKGVRWDGAEPMILQDHPTEPWNCFKGFITEEEMTMLVKHVEVPQRSPFSKDCPQRPFESMISTMRKFPWYMTDRITVRQRHAVFEACVSLLRCLQWAMKEKRHDDILTPQLYRRLWTSAMLCHGFTITMRDSIAYIVDLPESRMREFNMPRFGNMWLHIYTLVPKPGSPLDLIEWYIAIIREETHRTVSLSLPNIQTEIHKEGKETCLYWGYIFKEMPLPRGEPFDNMTLAEMAAREFTIVTNILQRALSR